MTLRHFPSSVTDRGTVYSLTATISTLGISLILSIGDSVASGEGDPLVAHQLGVTYPEQGLLG